MDTMECINNNIEAKLRGGKIRNLNWDKVAKHILEYGPNIMVYAGINEDWDNTCGAIYDHGEVIHNDAYVTSTWGTPSIFTYVEGKNKKIDGGDEYFIYADEHIYDWTESALKIVQGK